MSNLKELILSAIEKLSNCDTIIDARERHSVYVDICADLAKYSKENRENPDPEVTDLVAQAYAIQRSVAGICSVGKTAMIDGFIKDEDSINDSKFKTRVCANILMARAKIKAMTSEPRSQGNVRGFLLTVCNLKTSSADANGRSHFKEEQVISQNHPEIKKLWTEYGLKAVEEDNKAIAELEAKADKTAQEVERLTKIRDQALPRVKGMLAKLGVET